MRLLTDSDWVLKLWVCHHVGGGSRSDTHRMLGKPYDPRKNVRDTNCGVLRVFWDSVIVRLPGVIFSFGSEDETFKNPFCAVSCFLIQSSPFTIRWSYSSAEIQTLFESYRWERTSPSSISVLETSPETQQACCTWIFHHVLNSLAREEAIWENVSH